MSARALEKSLSKEFLTAAVAYWKPDMLISLWSRRRTERFSDRGRICGRFTGPGSTACDGHVGNRPPDPGWHSRHEYISNRRRAGPKLNHLVFDANGRLQSKVFDTIDIPLRSFSISGGKSECECEDRPDRGGGRRSALIVMPAATSGRIWQNTVRISSLYPRSRKIDQYQACSGRPPGGIEYDAAMLGDLPASRQN